MKYRVVGWTYYDNPEVKSADCDDAAYWAIVRDIREHGYDFTGWDHQEMLGCAPVLNDGCKRLFSQRGFGQVMAYAHGDYSRMGYASYAFEDFFGGHKSKMPPAEREFDPSDFTPETDLCESLTHAVDRAVFDAARAGDVIEFPIDDPVLQSLGCGDTLTLTCEGESATYRVARVTRGPVLSEELETEIFTLSCSVNDENMRRADELFNAAPWVISVSLAQNPEACQAEE